MRLYGLLITKDDHEVFGNWCRDQLPLYDAVVCLDGSGGEDTERIAQGFRDRLLYFHESHFYLPHKTDHGLRHVVHREIVRRFGTDNWVMCCHADEFCYHDPRKAAVQAQAGSFDRVDWYSLHLYPHPDDLARWDELRRLPVPERIRHYHWDYRGSGLPWVESRMYRNGPRVKWERITHGSTVPYGVGRPAPFNPILRHFKVYDVDPSSFEAAGDCTYYRTRWPGLPNRTGLPFPVRLPEDFFVDSVPDYNRCDVFDGTIEQPWNMGEEFRPDWPWDSAVQKEEGVSPKSR